MNSLIRFNPTNDFRRIQRELDRVFDSFFPTRDEDSEGRQTAVWSPRVDLVENEHAYLIEVDLPGIRKEDVKINFHDGVLSVSGERKASEREEKDNFVRVERSHGHFYRSFNLPLAVDVDNIEAKHENGVLNIRIPKAEESKPKEISIS